MHQNIRFPKAANPLRAVGLVERRECRCPMWQDLGDRRKKSMNRAEKIGHWYNANPNIGREYMDQRPNNRVCKSLHAPRPNSKSEYWLLVWFANLPEFA